MTIKRATYIICAIFGCITAALWIWVAFHRTWSDAGSDSAIGEEAILATGYCASIATSVCAMLGLVYCAITCCQDWESTTRAFLVLVAPGGWTTVSFLLTGTMGVSWRSAVYEWSVDRIFAATVSTMLWFVAEVKLPETVPHLNAAWVLVRRIPHNAQEMMPYLHVLSPQEDDKVTAPHKDELDEYEAKLEMQLAAAVDVVGDRVRRQVAGLLRPQLQELAQEMVHTLDTTSTRILGNETKTHSLADIYSYLEKEFHERLPTDEEKAKREQRDENKENNKPN